MLAQRRARLGEKRLGDGGTVAAPLRPQLRTLLHYHCGVATFRTRQMMVDLQNL